MLPSPPRPFRERFRPSKLLRLLAASSLPSGRVGEPARESKDGVAGPENSALVKGRGPDARLDRRERLMGNGWAKEVRRDPGRDGNGECSGDSSDGKAGPALLSSRDGAGGRAAVMPSSEGSRCMVMSLLGVVICRW